MMDDFLSAHDNGVIVHIVRAFTDPALVTLGNPAGVVLFNQIPQSAIMSFIAKQAQQPITAFVIPKEEAGEFYIRYYDLGGRECHICGHATVAATRWLCEEFPALREFELSFELDKKFFGGTKRELRTRAHGDDIEIDLFPSVLEPVSNPVFINKVASVLGIPPEEIISAAFSTNVRDYVLALASPDALLNMKPDFLAMKEMAEGGEFPHEGMMVSSRAPTDSGFDLFVRVFLPITGVNEDIACGSGNCSIVPFWHGMGLNTDTKIYRAVFPYPEVGGNDIVGGIQHVTFDPEIDRITIRSQATVGASIRVEYMVAPSNQWPDNRAQEGSYSNGDGIGYNIL